MLIPIGILALTNFPALKRFSRHCTQKKENAKICHTPCQAREWSSPSLFCFAVVRTASYEPALIKAQLTKKAGIFACAEFLVLSDSVLNLGPGPGGTVQTVPIGSLQVGISKDGTAANTEVFMRAWNAVHEDCRYRAHEWTIKADPDAVILPDRLRDKLAPHTGPPLYVKNCAKNQGPGWPMMFGSLEALSRAAVEAYFTGAQRCRNELGWQSWGEDVFMAMCLDHLGVGNIFDVSISGDNVCTGANCADGWHGSYHPFKDPGSWFSCWGQATR